MHVIVAEALTKDHGSVRALDSLDLTVEEGSVLALLGPNGAGKTTVVRVLSTLVRPDGGRARVAGYDVVDQAESVRRSIGLSGQYAAVDQYLTGRENLVMFARLHRMRRREAVRRAEDLLDRFDLTEVAGRQARTYSGGMRRRLDLAACLIARPRLIMLDEPTTGLDVRSRLATWEAVGELVAAGTTVLLTTQYLEEADQLADRVLVIDKGRRVVEGTPDDLKSRVGGERLEAVVRHDTDIPAVRAALAAAGTAEPAIERQTRVVTVPVSGGTSALARVAGRLAVEGIAVRELGLRRATLDDVFLTVTGRERPVAADVDTGGQR